MPAKLNLTGQRFGRLVALRRTVNSGAKTQWLCQCDCGGQVPVITHHLKSGNTSSCGCIRRATDTPATGKHGLYKLPEYKIWKGIRKRCFNKNVPRYHCYGGRGITICERWSDFELFYEDMGPRPSPNHTIERKENNGNYEPSNCIWLPKSEQSKNRRPSSEWRRG